MSRSGSDPATAGPPATGTSSGPSGQQPTDLLDQIARNRRPACVLLGLFGLLAMAVLTVVLERMRLPFDSTYTPTTELDWSECIDLLGCRRVLVPTASLTGERVRNDIFHSPRLGGKLFSSSGLGSGFSMAEATLHGVCELIERHAQRLAELEIDNPGKVGSRRFWFVDEATLPEAPRRIVGKYRCGGMSVRLLDMTSDIAVPTFYVRVFDDPFSGSPSTTSDGFACHPDPEVALTMALLEAAQTRCSRRRWAEQPITAATFGSLLWHSARNRATPHAATPDEPVSRSYPSGGAAYSLELYPVLSGAAVESIPAGIHRYRPEEHALEPVESQEEAREAIHDAAARSAGCAPPPVVLVITSRFARQAAYGTLAYSLILKEVGGLFQTLYLVAEHLGLAACALGAGTPDAAFAHATGTNEHTEPIVGEFMIGPRA